MVEDLTTQEAEDELISLGKELEYHDHLYYNEDNTILSDADYDALAAREQAIEKRLVY